MESSTEFQQRWSISKVFGTGFLVTAVVCLLVFAGFFFYYFSVAWRGGAEQAELDKKFSEKQLSMSTPGGGRVASTNSETVKNWTSFVGSNNAVFGDKNAPITILAFIDFQCPYCKKAHASFFNTVKDFSPLVKVVFKHFPVEQLHQQARLAGKAAQCALPYGKFWEFHDSLFLETEISEESIVRIAKNLGLDVSIFSACLADSKIDAVLDTDLRHGLTAGVRGTPTYIVNGVLYEGVMTDMQWKEIVVEALNKK